MTLSKKECTKGLLGHKNRTGIFTILLVKSLSQDAQGLSWTLHFSSVKKGIEVCLELDNVPIRQPEIEDEIEDNQKKGKKEAKQKPEVLACVVALLSFAHPEQDPLYLDLSHKFSTEKPRTKAVTAYWETLNETVGDNQLFVEADIRALHQKIPIF